MQNPRSTRVSATNIYRQFLLVLCCMTIFFAGCTDATNTLSHSNDSNVANNTPGSSKTEVKANPTEEALRARVAKAQQMIQGMTLEQKIGQLIIVEFFGSDYQESQLQYMVTQQFVGGYLYQYVNHNFDAPNNTVDGARAFADKANSDAKVPLLVTIDQEGGLVSKLETFFGTPISAEQMTASGNPNTALAQGTQDAKWMTQLGINTNLAPVVDVGPDTNLLYTRYFSADPKVVATYAGAFLNGLQTNQNSKVIGCLKHFPGLGTLSTAQDPHDALYPINRSKAEWENIDLEPYKQLIPQNHPAMIMSTDVTVPAIDSTLPAELSPKLVDGVLRKELGYNGVVITDGLYMKGIIDNWSLGEASVLSIIAGNDLIEGPYEPNQIAEVVAAFKKAIQDGRLSEERINQSLQRILLMKMDYGLIK